MAYDNRDILKWKRIIDSIQSNEQSVDKPMAEGTWSVPETPEQVKKLTTLLKNPLDAETALDELYDVFGDDELFDDLEVMKREEPETDVRHVVIRRLKDMNFIKEVRENAKPTKESLASTTDDLHDLETIVMTYWDRLDDDMKEELRKFWDEPKDTDEIKPFEAKKGLKEEDDEELINKVAEWIYHESSEPISEIEYLLKKSDAVGEYMDAVSESKEKVTEEEECSACDGTGWDRSVTSDEDDRGCDECGGTGKIEESVNEGGVHRLRVDQQTHVTAEHHDVVVSSNDMGIIVDIYDKKSDNIDTNTYWNDDVTSDEEKDSSTV